MNYEAIVWLIFFVAFLVGEAATVSLTSIWFAGGSLVALITALLGGPIWLQILLFLLVSGALLAATRPLAKKYLVGKQSRTNADRIIGLVGICTEAIDNIEGTGEVHIGGKRWSARSESGAVIEKDARVTVLRIEGVKVFVEPVPAAEAAAL